MKWLALAIGMLGVCFAASSAARADFAVIRFPDRSCTAWAESQIGPWPPGSVYLAVGLPTWQAAVQKGQGEMARHRCTTWIPR